MSEFDDLPPTLFHGTVEFQKAYWNWWDNQTPEFRAKYANYPADMSHVYFYNTVWRKRHERVNN